MSFTPPTMIAPFWGWTEFTPALPDFYWDVYSAEERIKKMCMEFHKLCEYANMLGDNINIDHELIKELQNAFQRFIDGQYDDYYKAMILKWINENMERLIAAAIKHLYFGLTDDGYFCAYIPESWSDIVFDTGAVFGRSDYGRLILKMNVDAPNAIDNTYSYSLNAKPSTIQQIITDLERATLRGDASYETLFTNMDVEVSNGNF